MSENKFCLDCIYGRDHLYLDGTEIHRIVRPDDILYYRGNDTEPFVTGSYFCDKEKENEWRR